MIDNIYVPYRFADETQFQYRDRQKSVKIEQKNAKRGKLVWNSLTNGQYKKG